MSNKDFLVGLDIGTTKICAIVGKLDDSKKLEIVGVGTYPSYGLKKGVVINIDATVDSISKAIEEAELMASCDISSVYAGIAGGHIKSFNSSGFISIKDREITETDVQRVVESAKAVSIPLDREVIHAIPQEYLIDGQSGIKDPVGMNGSKLEAKVHIVTGAVSSAQNMIKSVNKAGINVTDIVLQPLASAEAVLSETEKSDGVVLIDVGGGTTDIAVFHEGTVIFSSVVAIGGNHITNDIAIGLRTPQGEAEKIKIKYGSAVSSSVDPEETIEVPSIGGKKNRAISRRIVAEIIEPRVEELFTIIQNEIAKAGYLNKIRAGIVITGGSSLLDGITELAENVFDMPVKRGLPTDVVGLKDIVANPKYATGVGLLKYALKTHDKNKFPIRDKNIYDKVKNSMKNWIKDIF